MSKLDIALNEINKALNQPAVEEDQEIVTWWNRVAKYYTSGATFYPRD